MAFVRLVLHDDAVGSKKSASYRILDMFTAIVPLTSVDIGVGPARRSAQPVVRTCIVRHERGCEEDRKN